MENIEKSMAFPIQTIHGWRPVYPKSILAPKYGTIKPPTSLPVADSPNIFCKNLYKFVRVFLIINTLENVRKTIK